MPQLYEDGSLKWPKVKANLLSVFDLVTHKFNMDK